MTDWPGVPGRAGTLWRAGVHAAPQPDPYPPGQAGAPQASPRPGKGLTKAAMGSYEMQGTWELGLAVRKGRQAMGHSRCPLTM